MTGWQRVGAFAIALSIMLTPAAGAGVAGQGWHVVGDHVRFSSLQAVHAVDRDDVWAVGATYDEAFRASAHIEHWDGAIWSPAPVPDTGGVDSLLTGISGTSRDDLWAVGEVLSEFGEPYSTLVLHWDGEVWEIVASPSPGAWDDRLDDVVAIASDDVWAVGTSDEVEFGDPHPLTIHWDGSSWAPVPAPNPGTSGAVLSSVDAAAPDEVFAVGQANQTSGAETLAMRWDGLSWEVMPTPNVEESSNSLSAVAASSESDVWAVGASDKIVGGPIHKSKTLILHWDGFSWAVAPSPSPSHSQNFLSDVVVVSPTEVWTVGFATVRRGRITLTARWDGSHWRQERSPNPGETNYLYGASTAANGDVWAVGEVLNVNVGTALTLGR